MCQCTYCKDVYVGLIWVRVIYLPKDYYENFRWNIFEICSIYLSICWSTREGFDFYQCNIIIPITAGQNNHCHCRCTIYYNTANVPGNSVWNHKRHLQLCFTPRENYLYWSYCWPLLSLYNCWAFYRTCCTYFSNLSILQNLWNISRYHLFFFFSPSQQLVHEKVKPHNEVALFYKLLHVIQPDWKYLTPMLNNNKTVMVSIMSLLLYQKYNQLYLKWLLLLARKGVRLSFYLVFLQYESCFNFLENAKVVILKLLSILDYYNQISLPYSSNN